MSNKISPITDVRFLPVTRQIQFPKKSVPPGPKMHANNNYGPPRPKMPVKSGSPQNKSVPPPRLGWGRDMQVCLS